MVEYNFTILMCTNYSKSQNVISLGHFQKNITKVNYAGNEQDIHAWYIGAITYFKWIKSRSEFHNNCGILSFGLTTTFQCSVYRSFAVILRIFSVISFQVISFRRLLDFYLLGFRDDYPIHLTLRILVTEKFFFFFVC